VVPRGVPWASADQQWFTASPKGPGVGPCAGSNMARTAHRRPMLVLQRVCPSPCRKDRTAAPGDPPASHPSPRRPGQPSPAGAFGLPRRASRVSKRRHGCRHRDTHPALRVRLSSSRAPPDTCFELRPTPFRSGCAAPARSPASPRARPECRTGQKVRWRSPPLANALSLSHKAGDHAPCALTLN
jgi:hypothetical protein